MNIKGPGLKQNLSPYPYPRNISKQVTQQQIEFLQQECIEDSTNLLKSVLLKKTFSNIISRE